MTLIVEDGTGKTDAESYISIADADTYVTRWYGTHTEWSALSDTDKEIALRKGARYIDNFDFLGLRTNEDQALRFPRYGLGSIDGKYYDTDEIPLEIRGANVEAALKDAEGETLFPDNYGGTIESESKTVASLSTSVTYKNSKSAEKEFTIIKRLLYPFTDKGNKIERGIG